MDQVLLSPEYLQAWEFCDFCVALGAQVVDRWLQLWDRTEVCHLPWLWDRTGLNCVTFHGCDTGLNCVTFPTAGLCLAQGRGAPGLLSGHC